jgi:hypothetical protein
MTLPRGPFRTVAAGVELMAGDTSVMASFQNKITSRGPENTAKSVVIIVKYGSRQN